MEVLEKSVALHKTIASEVSISFRIFEFFIYAHFFPQEIQGLQQHITESFEKLKTQIMTDM